MLFVGRLEPRKGVDRLIRAMPIVQRHAPDVRLAIVGDGPDRAALEAAARDAGVDVLFTGRVSDALLPAYYRAADIVCSPALGDESFGIVLLEAMAAERPIVATRIEGYAEMLAEREAPGWWTWTTRRPWPARSWRCWPIPSCGDRSGREEPRSCATTTGTASPGVSNRSTDRSWHADLQVDH